MKMFRLMILIGLLFNVLITSANAAIETREVKYEVDGKSFTGILSWDRNIKTQMPAVILVHEWWGLNEYVRNRAKQVAELGYITFALDMYGDGKHTEDVTEAKNMMSSVHGNWSTAQKRFEKALEVVRKNPQVNTAKIAAIGYCFGGGVVLEMAKRGLPLQAVVSFHGGLNTPTKPVKGKITSRILVLNGANDAMVPATDIETFKKDMNAAGAVFKFVNYPNAKHAFTNPGADKLGKLHNIPIAYNKEADQASWLEMKGLFHEIF